MDHADVGDPHGEGEEDFGVAEVRGPVGDLREEGADEQAGGHAGEAEKEGAESDGIDGGERGELDAGGTEGFVFEAALLHEVKCAGDEAYEQGRVGGEQKRDVQEEPAGLQARERDGFQAGAEGGQQAEEEAEREQEGAEREGSVTGVNGEEGEGQQEAKGAEGLVGGDREGVVGRVEGFGERDEVEQHGDDGGGDGEQTPAGAVVEGRGQHGEGGDAVEEDRDSEPEEGHGPLISISVWEGYAGRMRFETVVGDFLLRFPEYRAEVYEPMGDEEPLACVAFGDTVVPRLKAALTNGDLARILRFTSFLEEMAENAQTDFALKNLLVVEIGEWLSVTDQEAQIAPWLGPETKRLCRYVPGLPTQRMMVAAERENRS